MGTMRLVLDACGHGLPVEVGVDRLSELLPDPDNRVWLDIRDPGPAEDGPHRRLLAQQRERPHRALGPRRVAGRAREAEQEEVESAQRPNPTRCWPESVCT